MTPGLHRMRVAGTALGFAALFVLALGRVFQLSVIDGRELRVLASKQQHQRIQTPPDRGAIVDRNGEVLAFTVESAAVYVRPRSAVLPPEIVPALARALDVAPATVRQKLASPEPFVWLARSATPEQARASAALGILGIGSEPSRRRHYPHGALAGQLVGLAGVDSQGLEGIELQYDRYLRGAPRTLRLERDARGRPMLTDLAPSSQALEGARIELTIDAALQRVAEDELAAAVGVRRAAAGVAVVMDPETGEMLALANFPRFDPNQPSALPRDVRRNRVVADTYEPGSTFKTFVAAAAIDAGIVRPEDRIFCENGSYAVGNRVVHDHDPFGWLTFADVIKHSSNIGAAKIGERLGSERLGKALQDFGFDQVTRIDLPGEVNGLVWPWQRWARINLVTTSFGQGISVTPVQLLRAYAAIANGGKLLRPFVVRRVTAADGRVLQESQPEVVRRPISPKTAAIVTDLLRSVVDGGTGTKARLDGIPVAGKTGTAQKVDYRTGRYSARDRMSSFVGYLPADNPRFVILVVIDSPRTATYGGVVAGPVFQHIAEYAVDRAGLRAAAAAPLPPRPSSEGPVLVNWTPNEAPRGMPSFIGLSMREALVQAQRAGWTVDADGSGFVIAQDPPPGTATARDRKLRLRFGSGAG